MDENRGGWAFSSLVGEAAFFINKNIYIKKNIFYFLKFIYLKKKIFLKKTPAEKKKSKQGCH